MSIATDRSCPNCGNVKGVGKVSALYYKEQADSGNSGIMSQRPDGYRRYPGRGIVIDRPLREIAKKLTPPAKPVTAMNANSSFLGAAGGAVVASVLLSFALTTIFGPGSMTLTLPVLFFTLMIGGTIYVQRKRVAAIKKIPLGRRQWIAGTRCTIVPTATAYSCPGSGASCQWRRRRRWPTRVPRSSWIRPSNLPDYLVET